MPPESASGAASSTPVPQHVPLAISTRGAMVDAVHFGSVAVVDRDGRLLWGAGDPDAFAPTRSALKPFQAMPFAAAGGIERFGLTAAHTALLCASHSGEPMHVAGVAAILAQAGSTADELQCGTHAPSFYEHTGRVPPPPPYSPLSHNCSGKHAGMLAWCVHCGAPKESYLDFMHPLQQAIRRAVAHFARMPEGELRSGTDGCSAPNYALPLSALALAFARLASDEDDAVYGGAPRQLAAAMTAHPEMVSGTARSDLALMQAGRGDWVTKVGAEGLQAIGIRSAGIGIAVKVADGNRRGLLPATVAVLDALSRLEPAARAALEPWRAPVVRNYRGIVTGEVRPVVELLPASALARHQGTGADRAPA